MSETTFRHAVSVLRVTVAGAPLPHDVEHRLVRATVEDNLHLPDSFTLEFDDPEHTALRGSHAEIGAAVGLRVVTEADPAGQELMTGEITALETGYDPLGTRTVIRGYDKSHRLFRGLHSETYQNVTAADVARRVATRAGLETGQVDATPTVHAVVSQVNENDWQLLQRLAGEVGFEVAVRAGRLEFRRPADARTGPPAGDHRSRSPLQLALGTNLLRFRVAMSTAEQVSGVEVRAWDYTQKRALSATSVTQTRAMFDTVPADLASRVGWPVRTEVATPYGTQAEVEAAALALSHEIAQSFVRLEGVAEGSPQLRAGAAVSLGQVGAPFEGRYVLTTTTHAFDPYEGYTTAFTVSGRQDQSTLNLASGGLARSRGSGRPPLHGVFPAVVTNNRDPDHHWRVRLRFPWLAEQYESDWARVCVLNGGNERGFDFLPEVNDEVLVAFEHGDVRRPYVLGGLHNGRDRPWKTAHVVDSSTGAVRSTGIRSKHGTVINFHDRDDVTQLELATPRGEESIQLDRTERRIVIACREGNIELRAGGDLSVEATGALTLHGSTVRIEADSQVEIQGQQIRIG